MYMKEYFEMTGHTIKISDIPDEMYGGALPIAKSRRSKKRAVTEAGYIEDAPEQVAKMSSTQKLDRVYELKEILLFGGDASTSKQDIKEKLVPN